MLADGTVLAVGGGADSSVRTGPVFASERFDPGDARRGRRWPPRPPAGCTTRPRLLLPDGRVLSAGQTNGTLQTDGGDLLAARTSSTGRGRRSLPRRPRSSYGAALQISTPRRRRTSGGSRWCDPESVTHSIHFDQRYVDLSVHEGERGPERHRPRERERGARRAGTCCSSSTRPASRPSRPGCTSRARRSTSRWRWAPTTPRRRWRPAPRRSASTDLQLDDRGNGPGKWWGCAS